MEKQCTEHLQNSVCVCGASQNRWLWCRIRHLASAFWMTGGEVTAGHIWRVEEDTDFLLGLCLSLSLSQLLMYQSKTQGALIWSRDMVSWFFIHIFYILMASVVAVALLLMKTCKCLCGQVHVNKSQTIFTVFSWSYIQPKSLQTRTHIHTHSTVALTSNLFCCDNWELVLNSWTPVQARLVTLKYIPTASCWINCVTGTSRFMRKKQDERSLTVLLHNLLLKNECSTLPI